MRHDVGLDVRARAQRLTARPDDDRSPARVARVRRHRRLGPIEQSHRLAQVRDLSVAASDTPRHRKNVLASSDGVGGVHDCATEIAPMSNCGLMLLAICKAAVSDPTTRICPAPDAAVPMTR